VDDALPLPAIAAIVGQESDGVGLGASAVEPVVDLEF